MSTYQYPGSELEIFAEAHKWKAYFGSCVSRYISGDVLEVGAGIGATARMLCTSGHHRWTCLEPDAQLADVLIKSLRRHPLPAVACVRMGTLADLPAHHQFDTILYVDVLEHIEDDRAEMHLAATRLAPGGALIVVAPAFRALYSDFDRHIGHRRRYRLRELRRLAPPQLAFERGFYLDALGWLLSAGNRLFFRRGLPTHVQVAFWDRVIIPLTRRIDPLLGKSVGRTVIAIWRRRDSL